MNKKKIYLRPAITVHDLPKRPMLLAGSGERSFTVTGSRSSATYGEEEILWSN